jgi:hypothetical protein
MTDWLPPIAEFDGDWDRYCDGLYDHFEDSLRQARFFGIRVGRRRAPVVDGKPDGFWHVTSEGWLKGSDERIPDLRRCERVPWIAPMISACGTDRVLCWANTRPSARGGTSIVIALPTYEYAVILRARSGSSGPYMMLVTAFPLRPSRANQFRAEYEANGEYRP